MYKHGTYSLYLRVKKKIQSLKQGERETKIRSEKSLFLQNDAHKKQMSNC